MKKEFYKLTTKSGMVFYCIKKRRGLNHHNRYKIVWTHDKSFKQGLFDIGYATITQIDSDIVEKLEVSNPKELKELIMIEEI